MSNRTYDIIKNVALLLTPVLAFMASLVTIWDMPHGPEITATLTALDVLAGAIVVAAKRIYDGREGDHAKDN